jgi:hypothetical protein
VQSCVAEAGSTSGQEVGVAGQQQRHPGYTAGLCSLDPLLEYWLRDGRPGSGSHCPSRLDRRWLVAVPSLIVAPHGASAVIFSPHPHPLPQGHPMVIQNMVPTLLRLYVDVEFTDQHNQVC